MPTSADAQVILVSKSDDETNVLKDGMDYIKVLAGPDPITIQKEPVTAKQTAKEIVSSITVCVPLGGLINVNKSERNFQPASKASKKILRRNGRLSTVRTSR